MSWDADLSTKCCGAERGSWNYTHNTSCMIYDALTLCAWERPEAAPPAREDWRWYDLLDGLDGAQGAEMLTALIAALEATPDRYLLMNPPNGWGTYDGMLRVLREMRDASLSEVPTEWRCSG